MTAKILLVDDDLRFRSLALSFLREQGYDVLQSSRPSEARLELHTCSFDVLIIDGSLPEMDGITFIRELRDNGNDRPIIFVSAGWRDAESYKVLTETLKVAHVLHKPIMPTVLVEHVQKALGKDSIQELKDHAKKSNVSAKLALMSDNFAKELPELISDVRSSIKNAQESNQESHFTEAVRKAHMLRGTAGTYGFPVISAAMGKIEDTLQAILKQQIVFRDRDGWPEIFHALGSAEQWVEELSRGGAATEQAINAAKPPLLQQHRYLYLTEDSDDESADGFSVFLDRNDALASARTQKYDAIVIKAKRDQEHLIRTLGEFRNLMGYRDTPVVVVAGPDLAMAKCLYYGTSIVRQTAPSESDLRELIDENRRSSEQTRTILSVDDDISFGRRIQAVLQQDGIVVKNLNDATRILEVLSETNPDLLLLDVDMPGISGFDVCRQIRKQAEWKSLPIVFVTGSLGWESRISSYESGGDDYLAKPVVNSELLVKVHLWLDRVKQARLKTTNDSLTNLLLHTRFVEEVQSASGASSRRCLSSGFVTITNIEEINRNFGPRTGDAVIITLAQLLQARFRAEDIRGRWSSATLAIAPRSIEQSVLDECLQLLAEEFCSLVSSGQLGAKINPKLELGSLDLSSSVDLYAEPTMKQAASS